MSELGEEIQTLLLVSRNELSQKHPPAWFTTPILRRLPNWARGGLGRSFTTFKMLAGVMWSRAYNVTDAEVRELYNAMNRHYGLFYRGRSRLRDRSQGTRRSA
jgi:hypothetical protein